MRNSEVRWISGVSSVVSFSCDLDTLKYIEELCILKRRKRSEMIRHLIKMGRIYLKILDEQEIDANTALSKNGKKVESVTTAEN